MYRYNDNRSPRRARKIHKSHDNEWVIPTEVVRTARNKKAQDVEMFKDLGEDLEELFKGWGDVKIQDLSDQELRKVEDLSKAVQEAQRAIMGAKKRKARKARQNRVRRTRRR